MTDLNNSEVQSKTEELDDKIKNMVMNSNFLLIKSRF